MNAYEKQVLLRDEIARLSGLVGAYIINGGSPADAYAEELIHQAKGYQGQLRELYITPLSESS